MLKMMSESQVVPRLQTGGCWQLPAKVEQLPPRKEASPFLPHPQGVHQPQPTGPALRPLGAS